MEKNRLLDELDLLIKEYSEKIGADKITKKEDGDSASRIIELKRLRLEFIYTLKAKPVCPASTLFCRIYLDKDSGFAFDIYDIITYLDIFDFHCYCFSYIENKKRLEACFNYITDFIDYHFNEIETLSLHAEECRKRKLKELRRVFDIDGSKAPKTKEKHKKYASELNRVTMLSVIERYTVNKAYLSFLAGDYEKSLEQYKKIKKKTEYERNLIEFIKGLYAPFQAIPEECASVLKAQEYKNSKSDVKTTLLAMAASVFVCSVPFFIAQLAINHKYLKDAILADTTSPLFAVFFALLPGIFASLVLRDKFRLLLSKNKAEAIEFYKIINQKSKINILKILLVFFTLVSVIIFAGSFTKPSIILYEDRFYYDDTGGYSVDYQLCRFYDIWDVYRADGRYKENGKYVKRPSYVIHCIDKRLIDTYNFKLSKDEETRLIYELTKDREKDRDIEHVFSPDDINVYL